MRYRYIYYIFELETEKYLDTTCDVNNFLNLTRRGQGHRFLSGHHHSKTIKI